MNQQNKERFNKLKKFGYFSKGLIYTLIGVLAALVAFGFNGNIRSQAEIVNPISKLPGGEILNIIIGLGLISYCVYRFYAAIVDPLYHGDKKRVRIRAVHAYTGALYLILAISFIKPILNMESSADLSSEKAALDLILSKSYGIYLIWVIAISMAGNAIWQFYLGYSGIYMVQVDDEPTGKEYGFVKKTGKFGYMARGVVFGVISFFMVKVALHKNSDAYEGTEGAFEYLLNLTYGPFLMGTVAFGMIGYGLFCIMVARYSNLTKY
ncbi:DUF1206 domain-containing protein [Pedobacter alpinus]|uniref:DUF1206 domain-containing protein n=1 Tax=Pedobacter alpinus TaxID=1590643 RepID=A0ABW5TVB7_9SPHI